MNKDILYYQKIAGTYQDDTQSSLIKEIRQVMNDGFEDSVYCKTIHIIEYSNIEYDMKAVINVAYNTSTKSNSLYLIPKPGESVKIGSIVCYNGSQYIINSGSFVNEAYWKYTLITVEHILKFYINGVLQEIPCHIVNNINLNTKSDTYMVLPNGNYKAYIPNWGICDRSSVGIRLLIDKFAYKISGVDTITQKDIICLNLVEDTFNKDDNIELGIADYYKYNDTTIVDNTNEEDEYSISLSPIIDSISINDSVTLVAKVFKNKIEVNQGVDFQVTVIDKNNINGIITYSINNNQLTIHCNDSYKNIGSTIVINCALKIDNNIYVERKLDIVSLV